MRRAVAAGLAVCAIVLGGCPREEPARVDPLIEVQQETASRAGLTLERAREIVAGVARVPADEITVMHRSVEGQAATMLAAVPAPEEMLYEEARSPVRPESVTEQTVETIDLRWDLQADLPTDVIWSERLQFSPREPVTPQQAAEIARQLFDRWVPEEAPETPPLPPQKLDAPVYVVTWTGMVEGHMSGDQAIVQVSSVTGLPISYIQRVALQRPSPEEIEVTRDEALEIVREALREEGRPDAETVDLVAQLTLSAAGHPRGGPAWMVALIGPGGQQTQVLMVGGMTGEIFTRRSRRAHPGDEAVSDGTEGTDQ